MYLEILLCINLKKKIYSLLQRVCTIVDYIYKVIPTQYYYYLISIS